jgi:hypothetical protein
MDDYYTDHGQTLSKEPLVVRSSRPRARPTLPVTISFLQGPPGTEAATDAVYGLPVAPLVAAFLLLAAIDHGLMAAPRIHGWKERNLRRECNPARWWE